MRWTGSAIVVFWLAGQPAAPPDWSFPLAVEPYRIGLHTRTPLIEIVLHFEQVVPQELDVARLTRDSSLESWHLADVVTGPTTRGRMTVRGPAGTETLLLFRSTRHVGYLLLGPFEWPDQPRSFPVPVEWRRTVRGYSTAGFGTPPVWLSAIQDDDRRSDWPVCRWIDRADWECVGVPARAAGIVLLNVPGKVAFGLAPGAATTSAIEPASSGSASWGRLVVVRTGDGEGERESISMVARRLHIPRGRPGSTRFETEPDDRVRIDRVGSRAFWVTGADRPPDAWVEITGNGHSSTRLELHDLAAAPPEVPMPIILEPALTISGRVVGETGQEAAGAVVTIYRFVQVGTSGDRSPPKRVAISEIRADPSGRFILEDLAAESYELVAMHPLLGRGDLRIDAGKRDAEVRLRRLVRADGRVLRGGLPAAGVRVAVVPDLAQFAASVDITELRGGESETDLDGRFSIMLASRGSGELRVGDERAGVRRIPLAPAETLPPVVDLGTIELSQMPSITLVLEGSAGCELLMTGPAGRTGMSIVRPTRVGPAVFHTTMPEPGRWYVVAVCGGRERAVLPPTIDVPPSATDHTIRLMWPVGVVSRP